MSCILVKYGGKNSVLISHSFPWEISGYTTKRQHQQFSRSKTSQKLSGNKDCHESRLSIVSIVISVSNITSRKLKMSPKNFHQKLSSKVVIENCHRKLSTKIVNKNCHQKLSSMSLRMLCSMVVFFNNMDFQMFQNQKWLTDLLLSVRWQIKIVANATNGIRRRFSLCPERRQNSWSLHFNQWH